MVMRDHPTSPGDVAHISFRWTSEVRWHSTFDNTDHISKQHKVVNYQLISGQDTDDAIARLTQHVRERMLNPRAWDGGSINSILEYDLRVCEWFGTWDATPPRSTSDRGIPIGVYTQQQQDEYLAINQWAFGS
jgi:hypothetical protein